MSGLTASWTITGRAVSALVDPEERIDETRVAWGQFANLERERQRLEQWQHLIDSRLIEWGRGPSMLEDDGVDAPPARTIADACHLAGQMRDAKLSPPTRIVPTPDGGIAFELEANGQLLCLEITPDGSLEYDHFVNGLLIDHMVLPEIGRTING